MLKSAVAVAVGFVAVVLLSFAADALMLWLAPAAVGYGARESKTWVLGVMLTYVAVFVVTGSWLTARLAPANPMRHALLLGAVGLAISIAVTAGTWTAEPVWYHVASLALILPCAWLGGWLRVRGLPAPS
jgi:hypothetical protein